MKSRKITILIILTVVPLLYSAELRSVDGDLTNFERFFLLQKQFIKGLISGALKG